ncbi:Uncharacterized membrane protein YuiB [[Clostridium] ultunense Esp]|uniref:YuiB family protein n=1 Tax=Thermicanus aegyptius TaxID=94009 RepID=UPI0002B6EF73|nr:YuiB family protein [Thermicanus aegyptius]CCQ97908.1 Uncharacterized membrane protein YuiB [[Clostridium] ultunense Esp]
MNIAQFIISIPLFMVLFFGIGFILNMLLKTTWLPSVLSGGVFLIAWVATGGLKWVDIVILLSGVLGGVLSSVAIRALRRHGYRMF